MANLRHLVPANLDGALVAAAIALLATLVPGILALGPGPLARLPVSPIVVAILAGFAMAGVSRDHPHWACGLRLVTGPLLKLAVMLIGLRLSLGQLGGLGLQALPLVAGALAFGLGLTWLSGRMLGIGAKLTALLAVGSAVCGVSAIAATAPALRPRAEETAYALACVALFGLIATLVYPGLLSATLFDGRQVGLVLGASIQDTAQVTAAALLYEQSSGDTGVLAAATVTKLLRNLSMLIVIPGVVWWTLRGQEGSRARPAFPLFILGFVALAAARSGGDALFGELVPWQQFLSATSRASAFLFAAAMAAMGMGIRVADLKALGIRPAVVALSISVGMCAVALLLVALLA